MKKNKIVVLFLATFMLLINLVNAQSTEKEWPIKQPDSRITVKIKYAVVLDADVINGYITNNTSDVLHVNYECTVTGKTGKVETLIGGMEKKGNDINPGKTIGGYFDDFRIQFYGKCKSDDKSIAGQLMEGGNCIQDIYFHLTSITNVSEMQRQEAKKKADAQAEKDRIVQQKKDEADKLKQQQQAAALSAQKNNSGNTNGSNAANQSSGQKSNQVQTSSTNTTSSNNSQTQYTSSSEIAQSNLEVFEKQQEKTAANLNELKSNLYNIADQMASQNAKIYEHNERIRQSQYEAKSRGNAIAGNIINLNWASANSGNEIAIKKVYEAKYTIATNDALCIKRDDPMCEKLSGWYAYEVEKKDPTIFLEKMDNNFKSPVAKENLIMNYKWQMQYYDKARGSTTRRGITNILLGAAIFAAILNAPPGIDDYVLLASCVVPVPFFISGVKDLVYRSYYRRKSASYQHAQKRIADLSR